MADPRGPAVRLVQEKPAAEDALWEILRVDETADEWTFDDVDVDSGLFGEIVSREIVERTDNGYRLSDPDAVRRLISADPESDRTPGAPLSVALRTNLPSDFSSWLPSLSELGVAIVLAAIVILPRITHYQRVFRRDHVVLPTNDPYYYRYLVESYSTNAGGLADVGGASELYVATMGSVSGQLGGSAHAVGLVLAWYPVVVALLVTALLYVTTVRLTGSRTLGAIVWVMLALTPGFALRTALGYADHHAFDYAWLALTLACIVTLVIDRNVERPFKKWPLIPLLGVGVGAQLLSWRGGILLLAPVGVVIGFLTLDDIRADRSPLLSNIALLAGFGVGIGLVLLAHEYLGWLTPTLLAAPILVFIGSVCLVAVAEVFHRKRPSVSAVVAADAVLIAIGSVLFVAFAGQGNVVSRGIGYFSRTLGSGVAETDSLGLFSGPIIYFGLYLFLAIPYLTWSTWDSFRDSRPGYLALNVYAWYFLAIALVQRRFVGELAIPIAFFVGLGFVDLASRVDIFPNIHPFERPALGRLRIDTELLRSSGTHLFLLFLLVSGFSIVQIPVNIQKVTVPQEKHDAALYIDDFAEERDMGYPENHVISQWDENRMYNYYVSHLSVPSLRYSYARTNFDPFLSSSDPHRWYEEFDGRVGFIVIAADDFRRGYDDSSTFVRLYRNHGTEYNTVPAVSHYRLIHLGDDETVKVFQVVDGATIRGNIESPVTIDTQIRIGNRTIQYQRRVEPNANGSFSVTVPYPGQYEIGAQTVRISEGAVMNGSTVPLLA